MVAPTTRPYISAPMTRRFTRLAWTAATFTYLLIILGAIVRITGSGLGCGEHWPLCNGKLLPPLDLPTRSEEHTSELQSQSNLVCRLLLEKKSKLHAPGGESGARDENRNPHAYGLDYHLGGEPPGRVEHLVVRGHAALAHPARAPVDRVVA